MASLAVDEYLRLVPAVQHSPIDPRIVNATYRGRLARRISQARVNKRYLWSSYDSEADVLYVNFKKPSHADDSELTDDDIIIRYERGEVVGLTILNASKRSPSGADK